MSKNEDDPVTGRSEHAEFGGGEVEPTYARSERLDRPSAPLPEARAQARPPVPVPVPATATAVDHPRSPWVIRLLIIVIVLLVIVVLVLLLRPVGGGGGEAATTSPTPTSTSTSSSRPVPTSLPTTSAATTAPTTGSASTAPAGGPPPSSATLTAGSYVDLDAMYPTTTASSEDEIKVGEDRITFGDVAGTWSKTRVVLVPTASISQEACDKSTVLVTGATLLKSDITPDQSICVSTNHSKWVVLTSRDHHFSSDDSTWYDQYTFATQVFPGPQPT
ncbi:hypothetical protein [Kutzneria kofuensis]|uniref:Uncharacterized protein n=1 Tax=Kutzneria kofuensis TaxID=103725 RepID=A0A7W9KNK6_9PSEU|nr:hypothetical protein [Kutzneria kofuensis]MBB5895752.1 hypothetical protein [Kutzneria kofuensis]